MSDFTAECTDAVTLDPYKRVCYSNGLVLGVDEFLQEELYLLEKHRLHNRALHGYGTVCGLEVSTRDTEDAGPEVFVQPGLALDPQGHEIRVPQTQCARLDEWLLRHPEAADLVAGSPSELPLYVVLCYRECKTDEVPVPGGPCRTLDDSMAPSRVADAFELALSTEPPEQHEEDAIRAFGDLLRLIEVVAGGDTGVEEMEELVRSMVSGSPPGFEPVIDASPPGIQVAPAQAEDVLRAAFRVWVTEVRPAILPDGRNCSSGPPREDCVLLAQLDVPVVEVGEALQVDGDAEDVAIDETARPYLLQTRVLQECCIVHGSAEAGGAGDGDAGDGGDGGGGDVPVVTVHADLDQLGADDHLQYLLVQPGSRELIEDLDADAHSVVGLRQAVANGEAVPFQQAVKVGDAAGGDVGGTYPDQLVVTGLQERPVSGAGPAADEVLTWTGAQWEPRPLPEGGGGGTGGGPQVEEIGLTRILALNWEHAAAGLAGFPSFTLDGEDVFGVAMAFGVEEIGDVQVRVEDGSLDGMSYQLFSEEPIAPGLQREFRLSGRVVPLDEITVSGAGLITKAITTGPQAVGAALVFDSTVRMQILEQALEIGDRGFRVLLRGEFVMDENERAVDAEHRLGQLPSGDRPKGSEAGIQGGTFESWFQLEALIDLNLATREELLTLPGIGANRANRIINNRPYESIEDLREVSGFRGAVFNQIRDRITV